MRNFGNIASYSYSKRASSSSIAIDRLTREEEDKILDSYPVLIEDSYRAWFVNRLRALGKTEFINRAEKSMKYGTNKQKYFVSIIKI